jgi:hypothetical protein
VFTDWRVACPTKTITIDIRVRDLFFLLFVFSLTSFTEQRLMERERAAVVVLVLLLQVRQVRKEPNENDYHPCQENYH